MVKILLESELKDLAIYAEQEAAVIATTDFYYKPNFYQILDFIEAVDSTNNDNILFLRGLRKTGKTILFLQMYDYLKNLGKQVYCIDLQNLYSRYRGKSGAFRKETEYE